MKTDLAPDAVQAVEFLRALLRALGSGLEPDVLEAQVTVRCCESTHRLSIDRALEKGRAMTGVLIDQLTKK